MPKQDEIKLTMERLVRDFVVDKGNKLYEALIQRPYLVDTAQMHYPLDGSTMFGGDITGMDPAFSNDFKEVLETRTAYLSIVKYPITNTDEDAVERNPIAMHRWAYWMAIASKYSRLGGSFEIPQGVYFRNKKHQAGAVNARPKLKEAPRIIVDSTESSKTIVYVFTNRRTQARDVIDTDPRFGIETDGEEFGYAMYQIELHAANEPENLVSVKPFFSGSNLNTRIVLENVLPKNVYLNVVNAFKLRVPNTLSLAKQDPISIPKTSDFNMTTIPVFSSGVYFSIGEKNIVSIDATKFKTLSTALNAFTRMAKTNGKESALAKGAEEIKFVQGNINKLNRAKTTATKNTALKTILESAKISGYGRTQFDSYDFDSFIQRHEKFIKELKILLNGIENGDASNPATPPPIAQEKEPQQVSTSIEPEAATEPTLKPRGRGRPRKKEPEPIETNPLEEDINETENGAVAGGNDALNAPLVNAIKIKEEPIEAAPTLAGPGFFTRLGNTMVGYVSSVDDSADESNDNKGTTSDPDEVENAEQVETVIQTPRKNIEDLDGVGIIDSLLDLAMIDFIVALSDMDSALIGTKLSALTKEDLIVATLNALSAVYTGIDTNVNISTKSLGTRIGLDRQRTIDAHHAPRKTRISVRDQELLKFFMTPFLSQPAGQITSPFGVGPNGSHIGPLLSVLRLCSETPMLRHLVPVDAYYYPLTHAAESSLPNALKFDLDEPCIAPNDASLDSWRLIWYHKWRACQFEEFLARQPPFATAFFRTVIATTSAYQTGTVDHPSYSSAAYRDLVNFQTVDVVEQIYQMQTDPDKRDTYKDDEDKWYEKHVLFAPSTKHFKTVLTPAKLNDALTISTHSMRFIAALWLVFSTCTQRALALYNPIALVSFASGNYSKPVESGAEIAKSYINRAASYFPEALKRLTPTRVALLTEEGIDVFTPTLSTIFHSGFAQNGDAFSPWKCNETWLALLSHQFAARYALDLETSIVFHEIEQSNTNVKGNMATPKTDTFSDVDFLVYTRLSEKLLGTETSDVWDALLEEIDGNSDFAIFIPTESITYIL